EDGIRDGHVTGVQTCALPISAADDDDGPGPESGERTDGVDRVGPSEGNDRGQDNERGQGNDRGAGNDRGGRNDRGDRQGAPRPEIGRASCRERAEVWGGGGGW